MKGHRKILLFHHGLVLHIEFSVMHLVKGLLHRFSIEQLWKKICQNILKGLIFNYFFLLLLSLDDIWGFSELHFIVLISLLEGSFDIWVVGVRVLPEGSGELTSLTKFVVLDELFLQEGFMDFLSQMGICIDVEVFWETRDVFITGDLIDLLKSVNDTFKFILIERLLWNLDRLLPCLVDGDHHPIGCLPNPRIHFVQVLNVSLLDLVVSDIPVEV